MGISSIGTHESKIIVASSHYGETSPGGTVLSLLEAQEDGSVAAKHARTSFFSSIFTKDHILFSRLVRDGHSSKTEDVLSFSLDKVAQRIALTGSEDLQNIPTEEICPEEQSEAIFDIDLRRMLMSATEAPDGYAMVFSYAFEEDGASSGSELLILFDRMGIKRSEANLPPSELMYDNISVGRNGTVALSSSIKVDDGGGKQGLRRIVFCDPSTFEVKKTLVTATEAMGTWLSDGSWIDVGRSISNTMNGASSPLGEKPDYIGGPLLHYSVTEPIDMPKPNPEKPLEPSTPPDADNSMQNGDYANENPPTNNDAPKEAFAQTSDKGTALAALAASAGAVAAYTMLVAFRSRRAEK